MSSDTQLKPCPFCGAKAEYIQTPSRLVPWGAGCSSPGCIAYSGYGMRLFASKDGATAAWNRRADSAGGPPTLPGGQA